MNIAQHSVEIEREVGNLGVMSWLSRHQPLPSANESWLGTILLVERIGVFPASGDIRRPLRDPYPLLAHLKKLYGEQALEMDDQRWAESDLQRLALSRADLLQRPGDHHQR